MHLGIDYGSKLAGTTAVCYLDDKQLIVRQSEKKQDADAWLSAIFEELRPEKIYLDAPLSLPKAYFGDGSDFFYRACDRELRAMSPMFLGGLTARAMKLKSLSPNMIFHETYPKALIDLHQELKVHYHKKEKLNARFVKLLDEHLFSFELLELKNWHQADAVLAWWSGFRHSIDQCEIVGDVAEGFILV